MAGCCCFLGGRVPIDCVRFFVLILTRLQPAAVEPTPARLEEQKWNSVANMTNSEATVAKPAAEALTDDQVLLNKIEDMYANADDKTRAIMDDRFKDAMNKSVQKAMRKNQQNMMADMAKAHNPVDDNGCAIPTA